MKKELYRQFSDSVYNAIEAYQEETGVRTPVDVMIELTRLCSIKCTHCYIGDARWVRDPNEMTTVQLKNLLDYLADRGTLWICFTGGEAMMRRDFKEIWLYAKQKGFILTLFTNATLIDEKMADFLYENPPFNIEVSVYGATEETYERVSLVKGSFKRFMAGITHLQERPELKWSMKTVVIQENAHELEVMEKMARDFGVDFKFDPVINASVGTGKSGGKAPCASRLSTEDVSALELSRIARKEENTKLIRQAIDPKSCEKKDDGRYRSDNLFGCSAGANDSYINADGKMQMCVLTVQYGARVIADKGFSPEKFEQVWDSFGLARKAKLKKDSPCSNCDIAVLCNNCPGFAFLENKDEHSAVEYLCRMTHQKAALLKVPHVCSDKHYVNLVEKKEGECSDGCKESRKKEVPSSTCEENSTGC